MPEASKLPYLKVCNTISRDSYVLTIARPKAAPANLVYLPYDKKVKILTRAGGEMIHTPHSLGQSHGFIEPKEWPMPSAPSSDTLPR